jgi:hypothetical protein
VSTENPTNQLKTPAAGSDAVLRGMMLLALMIILVIGGYAIFYRRPPAVPPPAAVDPSQLVPLIVQPTAAFPASVSWGALCALADDLPSEPGWQTRYQATRNLAHLGSDSVRWDVYREMLDERRQFCNFRTKLDDGRIVVEEAAARQIILGALKDLAEWHTKHARVDPDTPLKKVYEAVDRLAQSPIAEMKSQAEKTRAMFFR